MFHVEQDGGSFEGARRLHAPRGTQDRLAVVPAPQRSSGRGGVTTGLQPAPPRGPPSRLGRYDRFAAPTNWERRRRRRLSGRLAPSIRPIDLSPLATMTGRGGYVPGGGRRHPISLVGRRPAMSRAGCPMWNAAHPCPAWDAASRVPRGTQPHARWLVVPDLQATACACWRALATLGPSAARAVGGAPPGTETCCSLLWARAGACAPLGHVPEWSHEACRGGRNVPRGTRPLDVPRGTPAPRPLHPDPM